MNCIYYKPQLENLSQRERIAFVRHFRRMTQDEVSDKLGLDGERLYSRNEFASVEDLKKLKRYNARYNNIVKKVLDFKSPNQIVDEYKLNFLNA